MIVPGWLLILSWISLGVGALCALVVLADIVGGARQHMWIMNLVWPLTMLYAGPLGLWLYFSCGRQTTHAQMMRNRKMGRPPPAQTRPFWQTAALGTTHCGSGCLLGDICAECFVLAVPVVLFGHKVLGTWLLDYLAAFGLGIAFQYFTIKPMRGLSLPDGLRAALKADSASLSAWQLGMYGWMAIVLFVLFEPDLSRIEPPLFWFMMQIAMLAGFGTAYPVNRWLLHHGVKEAM